jgi:hypothetical protein
MDMMIYGNYLEDLSMTNVVTNAQMACFLSTNGLLTAYCGWGNTNQTGWVEMNHMPIAREEWIRLAVQLVYKPDGSNNYFSLQLNGQELMHPKGRILPGSATTNGSWFLCPDQTVSRFPGFSFCGIGKVDDFVVTNQYAQIDASAGPNGSILPSGRVSVAHQGSTNFTVSAHVGYHIRDVLVDDNHAAEFGQSDTNYVYMFSNVTNDHTITAEFARNEVAPVVDNAGGASTVMTACATLNGILASTGTAQTTVSIFWGPTDGGTNKEAWTNGCDFGIRGVGPFSINVTGLASNTAYYYRCWASNVAGAVWAPTSAPFHTLASSLEEGLVAYYPLNGNAADYSGRAAHGREHGGINYTTGLFGEAAAFDGLDDYIDVTNTHSLAFHNSPFSVSVWVQIEDNADETRSFALLQRGDRSSISNDFFSIHKAGAVESWTGIDGCIEGQIFYDNTRYNRVVGGMSGAQLPKRSWLHLVTVVDTSDDRLLFYLNGELQGTSPGLMPFDFSSEPSLTFVMGATLRNGSVHWRHKGLMDDVRVYGRALAPAEVSGLYQLGETSGVRFVVQGYPGPKGQATPHQYGTNLISRGTDAQCSVSTPANDTNGVRWVCTGWMMDGHALTSGSGTNVSVTLTNDATLTWQWQPEYGLTTATNGNGTMTAAEGWYAAGSNVTLTATAGVYWHFARWTGDVPGDATNNPLALVMTGPKSVIAEFSPNLATHDVPEWWLAEHGWTNNFDEYAMTDWDSDGFFTWQEHVADTDPTNAASCFRIEAISNLPPWRIYFSCSSTERRYTLYWTTTLAPAAWTNDPDRPPVWGRGGPDALTDTNATHGTRFYRLGVERP